MPRGTADPIRWLDIFWSEAVLAKKSEVNTYPGYHGFGELDRRSRLPDNAAVADATGGVVTATVSGLTRVMDEIRPAPTRRQKDSAYPDRARYAACLIRDSAGIPNSVCSFQAMAMVRGRLWLSTS